MTATNLFQNFNSSGQPEASTSFISLDAVEDQKLEAFEKGFQAGWEDALKAQEKMGQGLSAALSANLQDAAFQYHEMRTSLRRSVREVMAAVLDSVVPDIAQPALSAFICQLIEDAAKAEMEGGIDILVDAVSLPTVERYLSKNLKVEYRLGVDPNLQEGKALIRFSKAERQLDLVRLQTEVREAVNGYFETLVGDSKDD